MKNVKLYKANRLSDIAKIACAIAVAIRTIYELYIS